MHFNDTTKQLFTFSMVWAFPKNVFLLFHKFLTPGLRRNLKALSAMDSHVQHMTFSWHKKQKSHLKLVPLFKLVCAVPKLCLERTCNQLTYGERQRMKIKAKEGWVFSLTHWVIYFSVSLLDRNLKTIHIFTLNWFIIHFL